MNTLLRKCLPLFLAPLAFGQGSQLPKYTVATLPTASAQITYTVQVIDGTTNTDCVTGGASGHSAFNVICSVRWNGSAYVWAPANTQAGGNGITQLTGDVTAGPGAGSQAATLATVNSGPGTCGDATHVCQVTTDGKGRTTAQSAVAITGTGPGAATYITADATGTPPTNYQVITAGTGITLTPNAGAHTMTIDSSAAASGVQYITDPILVTSTSGLYDDNDSNSVNLGVPSSASCVHTTTSTCTVAFGAAHGLAVGGAIDMSNLASWPASPAGAVQQSAQFGSFQVTTVPDSTHITFTTPTSLTYTCSPCTGNAYDASLWAIWQFAKQPYIYGHATVYGIETTTQAAAANLATWVAGMSPAPKYLVDESGQNDFAAGRTVAQVKADHQTLWAAAHTAGMQATQATMTPAKYGLTGVDTKPGQFNYFAWEQSLGKTATQVANGQYIDRYADTASALLKADNINSMPNPTVNLAWAQKVNESFGVQSGLPDPPPSDFTFSGNGDADVVSHYFGGPEQFWDQTWANWMTWGSDAGGTKGIDIYSGSFATPSLIRLWLPTQGTGTSWVSDTIGRASGNNNSFYRSFHYTANNSTSNYMAWGPAGGTDALRVLATGAVQLPNLTTQACIGTDGSGNIQAGTCSGSSGLSGMTAGQIPVAATASTVTSSKAIQGTDTNLLSSGTVSGTGATLCTDANGGATTSGCSSGSSGLSGMTAGQIPIAATASTVTSSATFASLQPSQYRTWSCQPGLGDGLNAIAAGTYLQSTCKNTTGVTVTLTGLSCFTDNAGTSTMNAAGNTLGALLTGAVTCSTSFAAGTQSANVALTNGDYIKFTFVADGTSKQTTWVVTGTY